MTDMAVLPRSDLLSLRSHPIGFFKRENRSKHRMDLLPLTAHSSETRTTGRGAEKAAMKHLSLIRLSPRAIFPTIGRELSSNRDITQSTCPRLTFVLATRR